MERRDCALAPEAGAGGAGSSEGPEEGGGPGQLGGSSAGSQGEAQAGQPGEAEGGAGPVVECEADDWECRVSQDQSPWIVYVADEDVPGVDELFAIKLDLLGEMDPIKLNLPLAEGDVVYADPRCWSPDGSKFFFHVADKEFSEHSNGYMVELGAALPSAPVDLSTGLPASEFMVIDRWSPGGEHLAVLRTDGLYVVDEAPSGFVVSRVGDLTDTVYDAHATWRSDDELIHTELHADGYSAWRTRREQGQWKSQKIVSKLAAFSTPQLSPDGSSLTYLEQGTGLYAVNVTSVGAVPKLLTSGNVYISWSLDGSRFVLVADPNTNNPKVLLGQSPAHQSTPQLTDISDGQAADFSPNGSRLMVWRKEGGWGERLHLFDVAAPSLAEATVTDVVRPSGGYQYAFSNAGDLLATSAKESQNSEVTLQLVAPETGALVKLLDQGPNLARFSNLWFGEGDDFLVYSKAPEIDGVHEPFFVDLRHGAGNATANPLPGEGGVWDMMFVPGREALLFTRTAPNGDRDCQYVDISGASAAEPVTVNRSGVVQFCGTPWR